MTPVAEEFDRSDLDRLANEVQLQDWRSAILRRPRHRRRCQRLKCPQTARHGGYCPKRCQSSESGTTRVTWHSGVLGFTLRRGLCFFPRSSSARRSRPARVHERTAQEPLEAFLVGRRRSAGTQSIRIVLNLVLMLGYRKDAPGSRRLRAENAEPIDLGPIAAVEVFDKPVATFQKESANVRPRRSGIARTISQVSRRPIRMRSFFNGMSSPPPLGTNKP